MLVLSVAGVPHHVSRPFTLFSACVTMCKQNLI